MPTALEFARVIVTPGSSRVTVGPHLTYSSVGSLRSSSAPLQRRSGDMRPGSAGLVGRIRGAD